MAPTMQNIAEVWQRASLIQRITLLAMLLACVGVIVLTIGWTTRPQMSLLYSGLSTSEAAKIVDKIRDQDVPCELLEGGTTIYVPRDEVYSLRLTMASQGLPSEGGHIGYKILDDQPIGTSPFTQKINYIRAIEGELAKSIELMEGVNSARVHVVRPEVTLFSGDQSPATATVILKVSGGTKLAPTDVGAIVNLVAAGVEGLSPDKVVVVDSRRRLLSGESGSEMAKNVGTLADYKSRVEQELARKAEDLLVAVLGPERVRVRVTADVQRISTDQTVEQIDRGTVVKETSSSESTKAGGASNTGAKKSETIDSTYMPGKTIIRKSDPAGKIKSLSVAAFVDLNVPVDDEEKDEGKDKAQGAAAKTMTVKQVEEIIRSALGLTVNDKLTVIDKPFHKPSLADISSDDEGIMSASFLLEMGRRFSLGVLVVGALLLLKTFRGGAAKRSAAGGSAELAGTGSEGKSLPEKELDPEVLRARITTALNESPNEVKQLFASWVEGDKGTA